MPPGAQTSVRGCRGLHRRTRSSRTRISPPIRCAAAAAADEFADLPCGGNSAGEDWFRICYATASARGEWRTGAMPQYVIEREMPGAGQLGPEDLKMASQTSC